MKMIIMAVICSCSYLGQAGESSVGNGGGFSVPGDWSENHEGKIPDVSLPAEIEIPTADEVQKQVNRALSGINKLCQDFSLNCQQFTPMKVYFSKEVGEFKKDSHFVSGMIDPVGKSIRINLRDKDISFVFFHEVLHWIHYNVQLSQFGEIWSLKDENKKRYWLSEAIPFLAYLVYGDAKVTESEYAFLGSRLYGNLENFAGDKYSYGLVALWTRYLYTHVKNPKALLHDWIRLRPEDKIDFSKYAPDGASKEFYSYENLLNYFALALDLNTQIPGDFNLYSLALPSPLKAYPTLPQQMKEVNAGQCVSLNAHEFMYVTSVSAQNISFSKMSGLRLIVIRPRQKPLLLTSNQIDKVEILPSDRTLVFNPTDQVQEFCTRQIVVTSSEH